MKLCSCEPFKNNQKTHDQPDSTKALLTLQFGPWCGMDDGTNTFTDAWIWISCAGNLSGKVSGSVELCNDRDELLIKQAKSSYQQLAVEFQEFEQLDMDVLIND